MKNLIYLDGDLVPEPEAKVSIFDLGFMYSAVFMEALRTFNHKVFRLADHTDRLERSMRYAGLPPLISQHEVAHIIHTVIEANCAGLAADDDCWVCFQLTPGVGFPHPMMKVEKTSPTVMAYVSYLPYDEYARYYTQGKPAVVANTRNVPPSVVDPRGKTRFRLHYFMAKLEAQTRDPEAFALLLDTDGYVTEGTGANFFIASGGTLYTPTTRNVLEGISRRVVMELAHELAIPIVERDLTLYDLYSADEAFWTTSSYCLLPCNRINHMPVKQTPGPLFTRLIKAWSDRVGVDIIDQAMKYHDRESNVWRSAPKAQSPGPNP